MKNELLFLSKNDIPFPEAQVNIHQPTIREIAYISEKTFFSGYQFLNFSKDMLKLEDNSSLDDISDFEVFMSIIKDKETVEQKNNVLSLLTLLFPDYQIKFEKEIILINNKSFSRINETNFDAFKKILVSMFSLDSSSETDYNPIDNRAKKIADKLKKAREKKKSEEGNSDDISIFSRYISILSVGESKDMNTLLDYTVFQLQDEFKRFQMKQSYDVYVQAKMAGAKDLEEVDHWMENIHP